MAKSERRLGITTRVPPSLHKRLEDAARTHRFSLSTLVRVLLEYCIRDDVLETILKADIDEKAAARRDGRRELEPPGTSP